MPANYQTPTNILIASFDIKTETLLRRKIYDYLNTPLPKYTPNTTSQERQNTLSVMSAGVTTNAPPSNTNAITEMKTSSNELYSDSLNVQNYVTTVQQQAIINLPLQNTTLSIPDIQNTSKQHATEWTGTYFPKIAQSQADISDVCNNFSAFYTPLLAYANAIADPTQQANLNANLAGFKQGIGLLQNLVDGKGTNISAAINALTTFTGNVSNDNSSFQNVLQEANTEYNGATGEIATLQTQIDQSNQRLADDTRNIGLAAVGEVVGGLMIAVGVLAEIETAGVSTALIIAGISVTAGSAAGMGVAIKQLMDEEQTNQTLVATLATDQAEIAATKTIVSVFQNLVNMAGSAITSLNNMGTHWGNLSAYYTTLSNYCDTVAGQDPASLGAYLIGELNAMQQDFADLKTAAEYCVTNATLPPAPASSPSLSVEALSPLSVNTSTQTTSYPINSAVDQELANLENGMLAANPDLTNQINELCQALAGTSPPTQSTLLSNISNFQAIVNSFQNQSDELKTNLDTARQTSLTTQQTLVNQMASLRNTINATQISLSQNQASLQEVYSQIAQDQEKISMIEAYDGPVGYLINPIVEAIGNLYISAQGYSNQISALQAQVNADSQNLNNLSSQAQAVQTQLNNITTMVNYITSIEQNIEGLIATFTNLTQNLTTAGSAPVAWVGPILMGALSNWQDTIQIVNQISSPSSASLATKPTVTAENNTKSLNGQINQFITSATKKPKSNLPKMSLKQNRVTNSDNPEYQPVSTSELVSSVGDLLITPISDLKDASNNLYTTALQVQVYTNTVLLQPDILIPITGINLSAYQTTARTHALSWSSTYYPELLGMQANIAQFCNTFSSFLPILLQYSEDLSQDENINGLKQGISLLQGVLTQSLSDNAITLQKLNVYSDLINKDYTNYNAAEQVAEDQYNSKGGTLDQLRAELSNTNSQIDLTNTEIAGAAISEAAGIGAIIGGALTLPESAGTSAIIIVSGVLSVVGSTVALGLLIKSLQGLQNQANQLTMQISEDNKEIAVLDNITAQLSRFVKTTGADPIENATNLNQALNELNTNLSRLSEQLGIYTSQSLTDSLQTAGTAINELKTIAQACLDNGYLPVQDNTAPESTQSLSTLRSALFATKTNTSAGITPTPAAEVISQNTTTTPNCCVMA